MEPQIPIDRYEMLMIHIYECFRPYLPPGAQEWMDTLEFEYFQAIIWGVFVALLFAFAFASRLFVRPQDEEEAIS